MVDRPQRLDAQFLEPVVIAEQRLQAVEGKGDMVHADLPRRLLGEIGDLNEGDTVVLVVIGEERDLGAGERLMGVQHRLVPGHHLRHPRRAEHDMRHLDRRLDAGELGARGFWLGGARSGCGGHQFILQVRPRQGIVFM